MVVPDYNGGSIVNLMGSIGRYFGKITPYKPLRTLGPKELKGSRNVVLLVLDGLGYEYLMNQGNGSFLERHMCGKMTSVFPSTTAAAVTTFNTGLAPQQHAITGWFMHLKEIGVISAILPFVPRHGGAPFSKNGIRVYDFFDHDAFSKGLRADSYFIVGRKFVDSDYTIPIAGVAKRIGYKTMKEMFSIVRRIVARKGAKKRYIYAYWPGFDHFAHLAGVGSIVTYKHFIELNVEISRFISSIAGTGTTVIITADHGQIDTNSAKAVFIHNHPKIMDALTMPLCGEPRAAYCYVHPSKAKEFERYVRKRLSYCCTVHKSEELVRKGYFGRFKPGKRLSDRIGDYILLMKENYIIKDFMPNEKKAFMIGNHGGVSEKEMYVPLIVFRT